MNASCMMSTMVGVLNLGLKRTNSSRQSGCILWMDNYAFPVQFCVAFDIHCELIFKILNCFRNYLGCFSHLVLRVYVLWAIKVNDAMK